MLPTIGSDDDVPFTVHCEFAGEAAQGFPIHTLIEFAKEPVSSASRPEPMTLTCKKQALAPVVGAGAVESWIKTLPFSNGVWPAGLAQASWKLCGVPGVTAPVDGVTDKPVGSVPPVPPEVTAMATVAEAGV